MLYPDLFNDYFSTPRLRTRFRLDPRLVGLFAVNAAVATLEGRLMAAFFSRTIMAASRTEPVNVAPVKLDIVETCEKLVTKGVAPVDLKLVDLFEDIL